MLKAFLRDAYNHEQDNINTQKDPDRSRGLFGAAEGTRTLDPLLGKEMFYH